MSIMRRGGRSGYSFLCELRDPFGCGSGSTSYASSVTNVVFTTIVCVQPGTG